MNLYMCIHHEQVGGELKRPLTHVGTLKSWVYNMCEDKFWKAPPAIFSLFYAHCSYHNLVSIRWDLKVAGWWWWRHSEERGVQGDRLNLVGTWMLEEAKEKLWHYVMPVKHNKVFFSIRFYVCSGFQTKMWEGTLHEFYETSSLMGFLSFFWGTTEEIHC